MKGSSRPLPFVVGRIVSPSIRQVCQVQFALAFEPARRLQLPNFAGIAYHPASGGTVSPCAGCSKGIDGGPMWQSLGRNLKGLLTAACLLAFVICTLEIGLRIDRFQSAVHGQPALGSIDLTLEEQLVAPSLSTWIEMLPSAKATLKHPDTGEPVAFSTNSFGARGPEPLVPKPKGVLRVLCLGDETTVAAELPAEDAYPAQLQVLLTLAIGSQVEVINAGLPGSCPRIAALQLRHRLLALQPDLVVLHFDMSDVAEDAAIRRFVALDRKGHPTLATHPATRKACQLTRPRLSDEFLVVQQAEQQLAKLWDREMPSTGESIIDRHQRYRWTADDSPNLEAEIKSAFAPLAAIRELCDALGARLLVSTTPKPWQVSPQASNTPEARAVNGIPKDACWTSTAPYQRLLAASKTAKIPCVISLSEFLQTPNPEQLFLRKSPGLSARGHELYARALADSITGEPPQESAAGPEIVPVNVEEPEGGSSPPN